MKSGLLSWPRWFLGIVRHFGTSTKMQENNNQCLWLSGWMPAIVK
jgi:hypothetical protein